MANPVIEVDFRAQTTKFLQATERVEKKLDRLGRGAQDLGKKLGRLAGIAVGAAGVAGIGALTKATLDYADATIKASRAAGVNVETYQELSHAAGLAGIQQAALGSGLAAFNKRLGELKSGTGALSTFLGKYDEGLEAAVIGTKSTDEALELLIGRLAEIEDPAERAALAAAAFGRSLGPEMANMLTGGIEGLNAARMEAHELGKVLGKDLLEGAERANDAMSRLGDVMEAYRNRVLIELAPAIEAIATELTEMLKGGDVESWADTALSAFEAVMTGIAYFIDGWRAVGAAFDLGRLAVNQFAQDGVAAIYRVVEALDMIPGIDLSGALEGLDRMMSGLINEADSLTDSLGDYVMSATAVEGVKALFDRVRESMDQVTESTESLSGAATTNAAAAGEVASKWGDVKVEYDDVIGSAQGLQAEMDALNDLYQQQLDEIDELVNADLDQAFQDFPELFGSATEEGTNVMQEIWGNAIENMQRAFSDTIYNALWEDGIHSFSDFGDALVDIWKRMIAEMVSAWLTSKIAGFFNTDGGNMSFNVGGNGNSSSGGGLFSNIASSAIGKKIAGWFGGPSSGGGAVMANSLTGFGSAANIYGSSAISGAYTGGGAAGPAGVYAQGGGGAAAGGGAGAGMAGAGIAAVVAYLGMNALSRTHKKNAHFQEAFMTSSDFGMAGMTPIRHADDGRGDLYYFGGSRGANNVALAAAGPQSDVRGAMGADGSQWSAIRTGIEDAQKALTSYSADVEAYFEQEASKVDVSSKNWEERTNQQAELSQVYQDNADAFVSSMALVESASDAVTAAIIADYGSLETTTEGVADVISDGLITAAEAAAHGLKIGADVMISELEGIGAVARSVSADVSSISAVRGSPGIRRIGAGGDGGGFATGGIARGPTSGYRPLLHGNEAIVPLGNGDKAKFPVIIQSGGNDELAARVGDLEKTLRRYIHAQHGRGVRKAA